MFPSHFIRLPEMGSPLAHQIHLAKGGVWRRGEGLPHLQGSQYVGTVLDGFGRI